MTPIGLITNLARLIVASDKCLTVAERDLLEPELSELVSAFNASEQGAFMPLNAYAFDGDRAKAVQRWLVGALRADSTELVARTVQALAGTSDEWDGYAPDDHPLWVPTGVYDNEEEERNAGN